MTERHSPSRFRQIFWVTLGINAVILAIVFLIPFNSDLDLYHSMGLELARGRLPYIGSWDHNFPAIVWVHALSIILFGKGYIGFRVLDVLCHIGIAAVLFQIALRYVTPFFAACGATLNSLYYVGGSFWLAGQKDGFAVLFIGLSVLFYFRSSVSTKALNWLLFTGVALGVAIAFRPTYGLFSVSLVIFAILERKSWRQVVTLIAGHVAIWIVILLPYAFISNGLSQFYYSTIAFNIDVYGGARSGYSISGLLLHPLFLVALLSLLPWKWLRNRSGTELAPVPNLERWFGSFALASAWLSIYVMGKYLVYHFDPLMAILAVFAGRGLEKLYIILSWRFVRIVVMPVIAIVLIRLLYPFNLLHDLRGAIQSHPKSIVETVWQRVKEDSLFGLRAEEQASAYLEDHTRPTDKIEVCTIMPALRWRVNREEASPFTIAHPYAMHRSGYPFTPFQERWQMQLKDSIEVGKPKFLVLATAPHNMDLFSMRSPAEAFLNIAGMQQIVNNEYALDTIIGPYLYYKRKW